MKNKQYISDSNYGQEKVNNQFVYACSINDFQSVKYLLTSNKIPFKADINAKDASSISAIVASAKANNTEMVKFLASSPEISIHANIHCSDDLAFLFALMYQNAELIEFFIFDMNLERTEIIEHYLKTYMNLNIEKLFLKRDLDRNLAEKDFYHKVIKV